MECVPNRSGQSFWSGVFNNGGMHGDHHYHPEYELTWIESGSGLRIVGFTVEPFAPGDLVLIPPMVSHHYITDDDGGVARSQDWFRFRVIKFRRELLKPFLALPEFELLKNRLDTLSDSGMTFPDADFQEIATLIRNASEGEKSMRLLHLLHLLMRLAQIPGRDLSSKRDTRNLPDERILKVIDFLQRRIEQGKSTRLAEAAKCACMTPQAFSAYFRHRTQKRFINYMLELKLEKARQLLVYTDLPVSEVAQISCFQNLSNFNRRFNAIVKTTPKLYRKMLRRDR